MNNTAAYVPGSGPAAGALSMFSAAVSQSGGVSPLQEAIMSRMRPFGFSGDIKDLAPVSPFLPAAAGLGLVRPDTGFPAFSGLHTSPFLHPALDSRLPSLAASGPFR